MVTTNPERLEPDDIAVYADTAPERLAAVEAQQRLMLGEMRENARRSDENFRAPDAKIDRLAVQVNRLPYAVIGGAIAVAVGIIAANWFAN